GFYGPQWPGEARASVGQDLIDRGRAIDQAFRKDPEAMRGARMMGYSPSVSAGGVVSTPPPQMITNVSAPQVYVKALLNGAEIAAAIAVQVIPAVVSHVLG